MNTVRGNLVTMGLSGQFDIIIHGCNCFCSFGAGIAKEIAQRIPEAYKADLGTDKGSHLKLGTYTRAQVRILDDQGRNKHTLNVINAYTQYDFWTKGPRADYEAIRSVFQRIKSDFGGGVFTFGIPKIGAGLAGGRWDIISEIIEEEMKDEHLTLVEFDPTV